MSFTTPTQGVVVSTWSDESVNTQIQVTIHMKSHCIVIWSNTIFLSAIWQTKFSRYECYVFWKLISLPSFWPGVCIVYVCVCMHTNAYDSVAMKCYSFWKIISLPFCKNWCIAKHYKLAIDQIVMYCMSCWWMVTFTEKYFNLLSLLSLQFNLLCHLVATPLLGY